MIIYLNRIAQSDQGTFGVLVLDDVPLCVTCEDPWNDNQHNISCIPDGTYPCVKHNGNKYHDVWEVQLVPGRSAILIHQGNTIKDTEGCILVGASFSQLQGQPGVVSSLVTLDMLRKRLPDKFSLEVRTLV